MLQHCGRECKLIQPVWRTIWIFLKKKKKKPKNKATIWSSNPTPGYIYGENMVHKYTCTPMFIAVLFTTANTEKQLSVRK